jgi:hypothetical protein
MVLIVEVAMGSSRDRDIGRGSSNGNSRGGNGGGGNSGDGNGGDGVD